MAIVGESPYKEKLKKICIYDMRMNKEIKEKKIHSRNFKNNLNIKYCE